MLGRQRLLVVLLLGILVILLASGRLQTLQITPLVLREEKFDIFFSPVSNSAGELIRFVNTVYNSPPGAAEVIVKPGQNTIAKQVMDAAPYTNIETLTVSVSFQFTQAPITSNMLSFFFAPHYPGPTGFPSLGLRWDPSNGGIALIATVDAPAGSGYTRIGLITESIPIQAGQWYSADIVIKPALRQIVGVYVDGRLSSPNRVSLFGVVQPIPSGWSYTYPVSLSPDPIVQMTGYSIGHLNSEQGSDFTYYIDDIALRSGAYVSPPTTGTGTTTTTSTTTTTQTTTTSTTSTTTTPTGPPPDLGVLLANPLFWLFLLFATVVLAYYYYRRRKRS